MSKPAPRSNFMQTLLLATAIFLLLQLFLTNRGPAETRSSDQILETMRSLVGKVEDPVELRRLPSAIQGEHGKLKARIEDEERAGKLSTTEAKKRLLEGVVLTGATLYRAGALMNDLGPLTQAYYMLHAERERHGPEWATYTVTFEATPRFPETADTGKALYEKLVLELRKQSENHLILGFLPGYKFIDALVSLTGKHPAFSYAFAAFLLALVVRVMIWPLAQRQYMWGRQMARLQPLVAELKERYKDKKTGQIKNMQEFNQKVMGLYREYGINPMSGCLPALIQIPYFILIYQCMLQYRFDFQNGVFLWIGPALSSATGGWIAPNLGERDYLLILVYAVSMIVTTMLTPASDPANQRQQRMIGILVAVVFSISMFFYPLPSAFVLYWVFTNMFATAQMLRAYRLPLPPLVKVNAPNGGVYPTQEGRAKANGQITGTGVPVKHKPKKKK